jgi:hypothetical protein
LEDEGLEGGLGFGLDQSGSQVGPSRKYYLTHAIKHVDKEILSMMHIIIHGALRVGKPHSNDLK